MKKKITFGISLISLVAIMVTIGLMGSGFTSQFDEEDQEAFEAVVAADNAILQTGVVSLDDLKIQTMSVNEIQQEQAILDKVVEEQSTPDYEKYFPSSRAEQLTEAHEVALENTNNEEVTVGGGTVDNQLFNIEEVSEGEKIVTVSEISWLETIYQVDSGYTVNLIFNKDISTYRMTNENGSWRVSESLGCQKEFAPDDYQGDKGTFDTFQEAVEFAAELDVEAENPF